MDKREVLRRLDQLCLELSSEEGMLKYLCNEMNGNAPLYYVYYGKMIGVEWTKGELEKVRSAIDHIDESSEVTEMCPSCGHEVTIIWDTERDGYKAYCPVCGERLMLCSACHDDDFACDYSKDTDSCRWNPAMKWQLIRETHAKALLMYIRKNAENGEIELTKLQKRCRGKSYFKTSEAREAALEELERCGYIRIKTLKYPAGGRPVTIVELTKEGKENGYLL